MKRASELGCTRQSARSQCSHGSPQPSEPAWANAGARESQVQWRRQPRSCRAARVWPALCRPQPRRARHTPIPVPRIVPAVTPSASPAPVVVDPSSCRLPVSVERGSGPPSRLANEVGFIDTRTGRYTRDASASVSGPPGRDPLAGASDVATYYSPALKRWLPVSAGEVAPDGRSYAWVKTLPVGSLYPNFKSSELLIHDVSASTDRSIWTHAGTINVWRWD